MTARLPLDVAREVAEEVGAFCLSNWGHVDPADIEAKAPRDFVSAVDRKAEDIARDRLLRSYPDIPFVGEERGGKAEGTFWIVDPLDGTTNFLSGPAALVRFDRTGSRGCAGSGRDRRSGPEIFSFSNGGRCG